MELEIEYVGVGAEAVEVEILTQVAWVRLGETITLEAAAYDANEAVLEGTPIAWNSLDPLHASVPDPAVGEVLGGSEPGTARIVASLLTGQADTVDVIVIGEGTGRVLIVSNSDFDNEAVLQEFGVRMLGIEFDTMNVSGQTPTLAFLATFQAVLLYENGLFGNAPSVGDVVYDFVQAGGNVVIGTFYWQDRSDNLRPELTSSGWGALEMIDPFLGPQGSEYVPDSLDMASIVAHPLTAGVDSLLVDSFHGGVAPKAGTTVVASWSDGVPLIGYRTEPGGQRLVAVSTFPSYARHCCFEGDFYLIWENALRFALSGSIPAASPAAVAARGLQVQRAIPAQQLPQRSTGGTRREN